jgi:glycosyltransferase involved in cell wall biosynthesis
MVDYIQSASFRQTVFHAGLWYIAAMRLLFIADGRSPTALSWLQYWIETGHQTHLASTFPCDPPPGLASFFILPVAFGKMARRNRNNLIVSAHNHRLVERFRDQLRLLRYVFGPLSLPAYQLSFHKLVKKIHPDLIHALRIPFEGMLASSTPAEFPLVVSIWGNDISLHAHGSLLMGFFTRQTLRRANGLISDTRRDIRLGQEWGFEINRPTLVVPGGGGIRFDEIGFSSPIVRLPEELPDVPIVVNPRGQRPGSLRQDVFFQSIPLVLEKFPQALFICPPLAGDKESEYWVDVMGIGSNTKLWPHLDRDQMWVLFKKAQVYVSPSIHDGTPNSLLEAIACGCFPVVGNIESIQEWIISGVNGLLIDANSPRALADGIISALEQSALRLAAKNKNAQIIAERADFQHCMALTEAFYSKIAKGCG